MNQKQRILIALIAYCENQEKLNWVDLTEKMKTLLYQGIIRPEKMILNLEQQKRFWELVEEGRKYGILP